MMVLNLESLIALLISLHSRTVQLHRSKKQMICRYLGQEGWKKRVFKNPQQDGRNTERLQKYHLCAGSRGSSRVLKFSSWCGILRARGLPIALWNGSIPAQFAKEIEEPHLIYRPRWITCDPWVRDNDRKALSTRDGNVHSIAVKDKAQPPRTVFADA